jgi:flagellar biosynthesis activator protein FlaF
MQNQAFSAYHKVSRQTAEPRQIESNLLSRSAANFQRIRDNWDEAFTELEEAMLFNRRLWTVFLTTVTREDNPLPAAIRENIANLGLFVMNQQRELQNNPEARKLDVLITINRELAAGLRAAAPSPSE